jgi:hypothetical protein
MPVSLALDDLPADLPAASLERLDLQLVQDQRPRVSLGLRNLDIQQLRCCSSSRSGGSSDAMLGLGAPGEPPGGRRSPLPFVSRALRGTE